MVVILCCCCCWRSVFPSLIVLVAKNKQSPCCLLWKRRERENEKASKGKTKILMQMFDLSIYLFHRIQVWFGALFVALLPAVLLLFSSCLLLTHITSFSLYSLFFCSISNHLFATLSAQSILGIHWVGLCTEAEAEWAKWAEWVRWAPSLPAVCWLTDWLTEGRQCSYYLLHYISFF